MKIINLCKTSRKKLQSENIEKENSLNGEKEKGF